MQRRHFLLSGLAAIGFILASAGAVYSQDSTAKTESTDQASANAPLPEISIGDPKAPLTIVEYSSLSCPHCAAFHKELLPKIKSEYIDKGKVRYVFREFPLNEPALGAAVVARCLEPSQYVPFIELLFARQEDWAFKDDALGPLKEFAKQAGLTEEKFNKCLDDETLQKKVKAVAEEGAKLGVSATPTLMIDGKVVEFKSYDSLVEVINKRLGS